jgi:hypothetical protein
VHAFACHSMHGDVCKLWCCAEVAASGEGELVSPVLPLAGLRACMTFPYPYDHTARESDGPHMHARPRHAPTNTPARFRMAKPLSTSRGTRRSRQRCASTEASIHRSSLASRPFPTVLLLPPPSSSRFLLLPSFCKYPKQLIGIFAVSTGEHE